MLRHPQAHSYYRSLSLVLFTWLTLISTTASANKVVVVPLIDERMPAIKPGVVVELTRFLTNDNFSRGLPRILPDGSSSSSYTVPDGKVFVITAVHITPQTSDTDPTVIRLLQGSTARQTWRVTSNDMTQISYAPGLLISAGSTVNAINFVSNSGSVRLSVFGYEVAVRE